MGVGIDQLLKDGKLERLKDGPVFWVDSADSHPCLGTASAAMWTLKCSGRLFHSGLPHKVHYYYNIRDFVVTYYCYIPIGCEQFGISHGCNHSHTEKVLSGFPTTSL